MVVQLLDKVGQEDTPSGQFLTNLLIGRWTIPAFNSSACWARVRDVNASLQCPNYSASERFASEGSGSGAFDV